MKPGFEPVGDAVPCITGRGSARPRVGERSPSSPSRPRGLSGRVASSGSLTRRWTDYVKGDLERCGGIGMGPRSGRHPETQRCGGKQRAVKTETGLPRRRCGAEEEGMDREVSPGTVFPIAFPLFSSASRRLRVPIPSVFCVGRIEVVPRGTSALRSQPPLGYSRCSLRRDSNWVTGAFQSTLISPSEHPALIASRTNGLIRSRCMRSTCN